MNLPLVVFGDTVGSDSAINFGSGISKAKLESEEGLKRLRRIRVALILAGSFTLVGGFACLTFRQEDYQLIVILVPEIVAIVYMLLQLYKIEKRRKGTLALMLLIIVILGVLLLIGTLPITVTDNNTTIRNDTLFIEESYTKEILIASITQVDDNATVPDVGMRTNGTLVGENSVGYLQIKEEKDVLLYLCLDGTNVMYIKIKNDEDIYTNFEDSALLVDFPNRSKAAFRRPTRGK